MLNPPIEKDRNNKAIKKFDRCIFKTIDTSSKAKKKANKLELRKLNAILNNKTNKNKEENKQSENKQKLNISYKNNQELKDSIKNETVYEIISSTDRSILLKKKSKRDVY